MQLTTTVLSIFLCQTCNVIVQGASPFSQVQQPLAFQSFFQRPKGQSAPVNRGAIDLENQLLSALENQGAEDRLSNSDQISSLVTQLEESGQSIPRPAIAPEVYGRWRLMQTTNADTASPIQRKAVDTSKFPIYQDIVVDEDKLIVSQVVKFSDANELKVDALASTADYPLEELSDRTGTGKIMGLNILGVSLIGEEAKPDPNNPDSRINFVFDEGNFEFGEFKVPYPVPFRFPLFRDAVKGWIDITYLSNRVRISRGNKGTTFVLVKEAVETSTD
mmetsp:Transcript_10970/g.16962  ORF Transcript_10970/g.16962 Transcript_10970/m.16962 type:complete len:276 (-) Transcript_10970:118-945(-)|eukprot:CAMPEP_0195298312 /NCGR_PEP_ID=MMETSP0707-20130614/23233_1 /TAXON_ID=33640 /ORGANISM="Asterionellopsis glacialis, Strain CCMP134" /LENGTH=275 /DNA_ID=CAMNT_0040360379 /DNA_START=28 /DNA_END=855 /DNA_ORIENTATION=-